jgi:predicted nucleic acid-binding protein
MAYVIDASVVIKWYVAESDSDAATALLDAEESFLAPDLLFVECASILAKLVRRGTMTIAKALEVVVAIMDGPFSTVATGQIADDALRISLSSSAAVSPYDASYVALAMRLDTRCITADRKLVERLDGTLTILLVDELEELLPHVYSGDMSWQEILEDRVVNAGAVVDPMHTSFAYFARRRGMKRRQDTFLQPRIDELNRIIEREYATLR